MATMERARPPAAKMAPTKPAEEVRLCSLIKPSEHVIGFYWRFCSKLFAELLFGEFDKPISAYH